VEWTEGHMIRTVLSLTVDDDVIFGNTAAAVTNDSVVCALPAGRDSY